MAIAGHFAIALEEHYYDPALAATYGDVAPARGQAARSGVLERLFAHGEQRIREMDAAGIDMQVLSHGAPGAQRLAAAAAVPLARAANDRLAEMVRAHPGRFGAFAVLPTADPQAAADELERTVATLGFHGAMVHGPSNGVFIDDRRFWPIFERAEALDAPLYLHPAEPMKAVVDAYYADYVDDFPSILQSGWGFTVEAATQAVRLVLSGAFDRFPGLKIILGHMGESLPFSLWRIDQSMSRPRNRQMQRRFREYFERHFWITTSGHFSTPALLCSVMELGADRILFAVDYPMVDHAPAAAWVPTIPLSGTDLGKIMNGNAKRLLRLAP